MHCDFIKSLTDIRIKLTAAVFFLQVCLTEVCAPVNDSLIRSNFIMDIKCVLSFCAHDGKV